MIFVTAMLAAICVIVTGISLSGLDIHGLSLAYSGDETQPAGVSVIGQLSDTPVYDESGSPHQIRMELPTDVDPVNAVIDQVYIDHSTVISIKGIDEGYLDEFSLAGNRDGISDVLYYSVGQLGHIQILTERIKECRIYGEGRFIYVDFLDPGQVYDHVVVIDAGHGGQDPGTIGGDIYEKDINLAVSLLVESELNNLGGNIGVYLTRSEDVYLTPQERAAFANDLGAELFVSVHENSTASGRISDVNGTEVLYFFSDITGRSKALAQRLLDGITKALGSKNRGLVAGDEIYVLRNSEAPAALVELGFMSNPEELLKLCDSEYQKRAASAIAAGIMEVLNEDHSNSNGQ